MVSAVDSQREGSVCVPGELAAVNCPGVNVSVNALSPWAYPSVNPSPVFYHLK